MISSTINVVNLPLKKVTTSLTIDLPFAFELKTQILFVMYANVTAKIQEIALDINSFIKKNILHTTNEPMETTVVNPPKNK